VEIVRQRLRERLRLVVMADGRMVCAQMRMKRNTSRMTMVE